MLDLTTGQPVDRFGGFEGDAHDLFFTDDGKTLITVDHRDATVRFWDVATGKTARSFRALRDNEKGMQNHVWHARLSPDGKVLAVTYQPSGRGIFSPFAVRLWDTATGKELHDLVGHHGYVEAMAFSPDGKYLVTGSEALAGLRSEAIEAAARSGVRLGRGDRQGRRRDCPSAARRRHSRRTARRSRSRPSPARSSSGTRRRGR